jgi:type IX secretion system PorP/SprF family membrane protein
MKKVLFTLILAACASFAFAQEQAIYSQYQVFPILINPGYTGFNDQHEFVVNARSSWTGFPGKPTTFTAMYNGPVGDKLALGGGIFSDKAGDISTLRLQANYAFRFQFQKARVGLGLSTEFLNRRVDPDLLGNPYVDPNDEILEGMADNQRIFDASVGAHLLYDQRFFVSVSLPNTIRTRLDEVALAGDEDDSDRGLFKHYIFQLGYIVDVPSQNFKLVPSMVLRQVRDVPYQIDINVQGRFLEDKLIAGLTFRPSTGGSMAFLLGTRYQKFQLYYSYDVSFTKFQNYNGGSHEVSVAYAIDRKSKAVPAPIDPNQ